MFRQYLVTAALSVVPCLAYCAAGSENAAVKVVDSKVVTRQSGDYLGVTVLGNLKNETNRPVSDMVVEARLIDVQGKLVDVLTEKFYGMVVMPGEQIAFRLQNTAASPLAAYARAQVQARVTSDSRRDEPNSQPKAETSLGWKTAMDIS